MKSLSVVMFICWGLLCAVELKAEQPKDLEMIIKKIEHQEQNFYPFSGEAAKVVDNENGVFFQSLDSQVKGNVTFSKEGLLSKHFVLMQEGDGYRFSSVLTQPGGSFNYVVRDINKRPALLFFNDTEVFVYTQAINERGMFELREWIYLRVPNQEDGSRLVWEYKADPFQWPLSLSMNESGQASIERNMPVLFKGMKIEGKAQQQYMLNMLVHYVEQDNVQKYFPFKEGLVTMSRVNYLTREGVIMPADITVRNRSVKGNRPKPKHGLDFNAWDDHWLSDLEIKIKAKKDEYPILITP